jgi:hypothetical protein
MARRGFSCPNCHTWFEGEGNHPRCPLCGTRASPRNLLDDRERRPHTYEDETPPAPDYEVSPYFEDVKDYDVPASAPAPRETPRREADDEADWGSRLTPLIGGLIFIAIIASRICNAVAG